MIAGILEAMWSTYPLGVRIVWQCLENHADDARQWRMTDADIAREVNVSVDLVGRAVGVLEADGIIRCVRRKRRPTTFYMLRSYPNGCQKPRHEPEVERRITPELNLQFADSSAELSPQKPETLNPPVRIHQGEEEDARTRADIPTQANLDTEQEDATDRVPFPDDDPVLTPEEVAEIRAAGHDPAELPDEVRQWALQEGATSNNWPRVVVHWARRTPPKRRRSQRQATAKPGANANAGALLARLQARAAAVVGGQQWAS